MACSHAPQRWTTPSAAAPAHSWDGRRRRSAACRPPQAPARLSRQPPLFGAAVAHSYAIATPAAVGGLRDEGLWRADDT